MEIQLKKKSVPPASRLSKAATEQKKVNIYVSKVIDITLLLLLRQTD